MSKNQAARDAYYQVKGDLDRAFRKRNSKSNGMVEFSRWEEVATTIDESKATFRLRVGKIDAVPLFLPRAGRGYQIVGSPEGWTRDAAAPALIHDAQTETVITAPPRLGGELVVSYKWSFGSWVAAWWYFFWRLVARLLLWILLLSLVVGAAWLLWRVPWGWLATSIATAPVASMPTPTPTPHPTTPSTDYVGGRPPQVGTN